MGENPISKQRLIPIEEFDQRHMELLDHAAERLRAVWDRAPPEPDWAVSCSSATNRMGCGCSSS
jgi:hypothetical protein